MDFVALNLLFHSATLPENSFVCAFPAFATALASNKTKKERRKMLYRIFRGKNLLLTDFIVACGACIIYGSYVCGHTKPRKCIFPFLLPQHLIYSPAHTYGTHTLKRQCQCLLMQNEIFPLTAKKNCQRKFFR